MKQSSKLNRKWKTKQPYKHIIQMCAVALLPIIGFSQKIDQRIIANDSTFLQVLETERGDKFFGYIQKVEHDTIHFGILNKDETYALSLENVKRVRLVKKDDLESNLFGEKLPSFVGLNRNVLLSSAFGQAKGSLEYKNTMLFFNQISYAPTNFMSTSLSFTPTPADETFFLTGDISFFKSWSEVLHTKLSLMPIIGSADREGLSYLLFNPHVTLGRSKFNFTMGYVYGIGFDLVSRDTPIRSIQIGMQLGIGENWRLRLEFINDRTDDFFDVESALVLPCLSWSNARNRIDFGAGTVLYSIDDSEGGFPYLSYTRLLKRAFTED